VEKTVRHDLEAQARTCGVVQARKKVMPLQDLMQHNTIEEATDSETNQQPAP
jgi:hypothetical protein